VAPRAGVLRVRAQGADVEADRVEGLARSLASAFRNRPSARISVSLAAPRGSGARAGGDRLALLGADAFDEGEVALRGLIAGVELERRAERQLAAAWSPG
jgi:hypothetical protein